LKGGDEHLTGDQFTDLIDLIQADPDLQTKNPDEQVLGSLNTNEPPSQSRHFWTFFC